MELLLGCRCQKSIVYRLYILICVIKAIIPQPKFIHFNF